MLWYSVELCQIHGASDESRKLSPSKNVLVRVIHVNLYLMGNLNFQY